MQNPAVANAMRTSAQLKDTYSIGRSELLLCGNNSSTSLRSVQRRLALDDSLAGSSGTTTSAAANLGDGVPVLRHVERS